MVLGGALGPGFGAWGAAPLCVAGVAQPDIHLRFTWQAWHNLTSTVVLRGRRATYGTGWRPWARIWRPGRRATLRGRRGTTSHPPSFHVAGVAQTDIYRRFAWQACHLWYWVARLGPDLAPGAPRHFAWQAWHNLTSTFVSRGRRGTISHLPSFCVAGVPLMVLGGALGPGFGAGAPRHFAWQAWHNLTSTFVSRGGRGTISHLPSFCVAGVPLMVLGGALGPGFGAGAPRHFAWQAWHNLTSTFVSRGRRGTISHLPSFCVAGVGQIISHTPSQTIFHTPSLTHRLCHMPSFTHNFVTHHLSHTNFVTHHLSHTSLSHPTFHTPSFTHHIVTHHLSHTIFHTQLCRTPSFTTPSLTQLCHTPSFAKPSFTHHFVPHHLSHTTLSHALFHTQLSHTPSCTHHFVTHTIFLSHTPAFTYNFVTHNFVLLLGPPPPPLSFLPSPSPLQHLVLFIQRSCLVGLSGPLMFWGSHGLPKSLILKRATHRN